MTRIKCVVPGDGYRLEVQFENGCTVILDFTERLHTVRFGMLADRAFFMSAKTDGDFISWGGRIEITASEVFLLAQK